MWITWCPRKPLDFKQAEKYLQESISRNHFTNSGPLQARFASVAASMLSVPRGYSVHTSASGSSALHALATAYAIEKGRPLKWVTQAFTFPSSAQGPMQNAVVLDICPIHFGPNLCCREPPAGVDGVVVTNCFGCSVDLEVYRKVCAHHNLLLLCDNANSPMLCNDPCDGAIVSLHETKPLGRGEGGLVVCPSRLDTLVVRASNFGFHRTNRVWHSMASNFRMSDIAAAFHMVHWQNFHDIVHKHSMLTEAILLRLDTRPALQVPFRFNSAVSFLALFPVLFPRPVEDLSPCLDNGIEAKKYYAPLTPDSPVAHNVYDRIVCFPLHVELEIGHVDLMFEVIDEMLRINSRDA